MVIVISVDAYHFFMAFSDLTCQLEDTEIGVFWLHWAAYSKETKLGGSNQEASPLAGKNTRLALVPCCPWKRLPTAISGVVDISEVPVCHLLRQMSSQ